MNKTEMSTKELQKTAKLEQKVKNYEHFQGF